MVSIVKNCVRRLSGFVFAMTILTGVSIGQELSGRVKSYMAKTYPGWSIIEGYNGPDNPRTPAISSGDFNGDGLKDYVVAMKKDDRTYAVVMLVTRRSIRSVTLEAQKESVNAWVAQVSSWKKGTKVIGTDSRNREQRFKLSTDAVGLVDGEGHSSLYYWKGGKFLSLSGVDTVE